VHGFGLADLIRVNQLVRGRIDYEGFRAWYAALSSEQRRALTNLLCEFAHQAGVTGDTWDEALAASGLSPSDPVVQAVRSAGQGEDPIFRLYEFVVAVPEEDLPTVFRLFVYLFGMAEGRVYRSESKMHCNHWWHRDLLDERVVRDLLSDSRYFMTAMKDDDRIKGQAESGVAPDSRRSSWSWIRRLFSGGGR
jgi:uncharacterized protein DUF5958